MDKAYIDFARLWRLSKDRVNFVIRAKDNMRYRVLDLGQTDREKGVICDQTILLTSPLTSKKYPGPVRRISYFDEETRNTFVFLTDNFKLSPLTVAAFTVIAEEYRSSSNG